MSVRVVRQSKFRHVFGTAFKREQTFDNIRITRNAWDTPLSSVNPKFIAVALETQGGGQFQVIPIEQYGRLDQNYPKVGGHEAPVLDLQWCPFNDNVIASCAEDCTVRVWEIPEGGLVEDLNEAVVVLQGHQRRVGIVEWHNTCENLLFSAGFDYLILLWNVATGELLRDINVHTDTIYSMSFSYDGAYLATTSKDKLLRVIDARSGQVVSQGLAHDGSKASRACFLGTTNKVLTTGVNKSSERQIAVWDPVDLSKPLKLESVDNGSGVLFPWYDEDTKLVFLVGKGDGNIRYYEIVDEAPWAYYVSEFKTANPQRGVAWMPKRGLNIADCEIARAYKLHPKGSIEPIGFTVPRKSTLFQDDIFPPTKEDAAVVTIPEWLSGITRLPNKVSLQGNLQSGIRTPGALQPTPSPAPPKSPVTFKAPTPAATPVAKSVPAAQPTPQTATFQTPKPAPANNEPPKGEVALIKAWEAQQKEIESLKKKVAQLEAQLASK